MSYIGAPYNFVPFSNTVRHYDQKSLPGHGSVVFKNTEGSEELISGIISYDFLFASHNKTFLVLL